MIGVGFGIAENVLVDERGSGSLKIRIKER